MAPANTGGWINQYPQEAFMLDQLRGMNGLNVMTVIQDILKAYPDLKLFLLALHSTELCALIEMFLHRATLYVVLEYRSLSIYEPSGFQLTDFPLDLRREILQYLDIRDIQAMAATCKFYRHFFGNIQKDFMLRTFADWGLNWMSFKWMLLHTDSLISGFAANRFLFPLSEHHAVCNIVDVYIWARCLPAITRYIQVATQFTETGHETHPHHMISQTVKFTHANRTRYPAIIAVHVCSKENPRAAVFRQPLSACFTYLSAQGVRLTYANFTLAGLSLPNHDYICLDSADDIAELKKIDVLASSHQIQIRKFHFDKSELSCPSARVWGLEEEFVQELYGVVWCLGSMGCKAADGCLTDLCGGEFFVKVVDVTPRDEDDEKMWMIRYEMNSSLWNAMT
ncbi:hypothetical protein C8R43DRAFT_1142696 [Mycena crocata]|nr:hypothetical protein C8R43DRAFT_1142696 [Mycena crocata]